MKFGSYLSSRAPQLCLCACAAVVWGIFARFAGANAVLLWGGEIFFAAFALAWTGAGYFAARRRLARLEKLKSGLTERYLLGELLSRPADAVEREYFEVMREVSRSAVGIAEDARREKEEYCEYVESWIHEIKTPLTACSLILGNGGDPVKLRRELRRADNLTETVLYYARMREPEKDRKISLVRVPEVVAEAVQSQRELLIAAGIGVETEGELSVYADGKELCFMLKQLLINCAKYCKGCRVRIWAGDGKLSVEDDGPGIPAHELPRVTARGFTGAAGRRAGGTGMGLYIVSELCRRSGIGLRIFSEEGKGTKFEFSFEGVAFAAPEENLTKA